MPVFSSLNVRLPVITVGLALVSATAMGGAKLVFRASGLVDAAQERLQFAASARKTAIELIADRAVGDLFTIAAQPAGRRQFRRSRRSARSGQARLRRTRPGLHRPGATVEARSAAEGAGTMYGRRHAKVQEAARKLIERPGYADLAVRRRGRTRRLHDHQGRRFRPRAVRARAAGDRPRPAGGAPEGRRTGRDRCSRISRAYPAEAGAVGLHRPRRRPAAPTSPWARARRPRGSASSSCASTPALFDRALSDRSGLGETGQVMAVGARRRCLRSNPPLDGGRSRPAARDARSASTKAALDDAATLRLRRRRRRAHGRDLPKSRCSARPGPSSPSSPRTRPSRRSATLTRALAADRPSPSSPATAILGLLFARTHRAARSAP